MIFDLYVFVSNFYIKRAHNFIRYFFLSLFSFRNLCLESLSSDESELLLDNGSDESSFLCLRRFFFLSRFFFFDNESDNDGSGSGSSSTFPLSFSSVNPVGRVSGSGSEMVKCSFPFFDG